MLDLRVIAASLGMMVALMSVALAEPTKDQAPVASRGSTDARPVHVRVILPAPWEPSNPPAERTAK
jgi:hypothetical protein